MGTGRMAHVRRELLRGWLESRRQFLPETAPPVKPTRILEGQVRDTGLPVTTRRSGPAIT